MEQETVYNYKLILNNLVQYLPAKVVVVLNTFFIIPLLTYFLDVKEVSIYIIALQLLNIFCTCSSYWISKSVLRFYARYSSNDKQKEFISTILYLSIFAYVIVVTLLFIFRNTFAEHFAVNATVLFLVGLLLIPCAIRQNIYQILRIQNNYSLYTISIIIYQLIFIILIMAISGILPNVTGILLAMITSVFIVDIFMLRTFNCNYSFDFKFDSNILNDVLVYGIPLVFTNILHWFVLRGPDLIFQAQQRYVETSIMGLGCTIATNMIETIAGLFIFVNFPVLIKLFEESKNIKQYFTNVIQLFFYITIPILLCIFLYSKDIVTIILPQTYELVSFVLPFFALKLFLHQTQKLINIKYHLENQTYVETLLCFCIVLFSILATIYFIGVYSIQIALAIMIIYEVFLLFINCFIKLKNTDYLNYAKILKSAFILVLICFLIYLLLDNIFYIKNTIFMLIKIVVYFVLTYFLGYLFRKHTLI